MPTGFLKRTQAGSTLPTLASYERKQIMALKRWQDWVNLILGIFLLVVPSFGLAGGTATATYLVGTSILLVSFWALAMPQSKVAQWCNILLGAGYFFAPWVYGFTALAAAAWSAWIVGALVVIFAVTALAQTGGRQDSDAGRPATGAGD